MGKIFWAYALTFSQSSDFVAYVHRFKFCARCAKNSLSLAKHCANQLEKLFNGMPKFVPWEMTKQPR